MIKIGITGNIACGKSTVSSLIQKAGFPVIDADLVSREVSLPGSPAYEEILKVFGKSVLAIDGQIDRTILRGIVFSDPVLKKKLESILHEKIKDRSEQLFQELEKKGQKIIFYEASLLFEANRAKDFDKILLIYCDANVQKDRLKKRLKNTSDVELEKILQSQMSQDKKKILADFQIDNSKSLEDLNNEVQKFLKIITS